jgi:hypothetical protein
MAALGRCLLVSAALSLSGGCANNPSADDPEPPMDDLRDFASGIGASAGAKMFAQHLVTSYKSGALAADLSQALSGALDDVPHPQLLAFAEQQISDGASPMGVLDATAGAAKAAPGWLLHASWDQKTGLVRDELDVLEAAAQRYAASSGKMTTSLKTASNDDDNTLVAEIVVVSIGSVVALMGVFELAAALGLIGF